MRFDSSILAAVADELQVLVGGQIQRIAQPNALQIVLSIWKSQSGEKHLQLDVSPQFYRVHLTSTRAPNSPSPSPFCMTLRKYLNGGKIVAISQRDGDRILDIEIQNGAQNFLLTCELMGKHANLILVSPERKILHAAKLISSKESRVRETLPGREYSAPSLAPNFDSSALRPPEISENATNISTALDEYFSTVAPRAQFEQEKKSLLGALRKTLQQKTKALDQVRRGVSESTRAAQYRRWGELILCSVREVKMQLETAPHEAEKIEVEVLDFYSEQNQKIKIPLDAKLSASENAAHFFERAHHVEENAAALKKLQNELEREVAELEEFITKLEAFGEGDAPKLASSELQQLREQSAARRWLRPSNSGASTPAQPKSEFGGHKIKRFVSPDGYEVLVGESATANDFLVTRLSHSNDWWLHLRGGTSSHAIIKTQNAPQRVPPSTLRFAAQLVAARSVAKHAGLAEVDYTLKKYVRKPRKAAPGSVVISNQKTLRVEKTTT